jgi:hypothetical protein
LIKRLAIFLIFIFSLLIPSDVKTKSSKTAKKLSFFPGAGQIYNGDYLKGMILFTSEAYSIYKASVLSKSVDGIINVSKRNTFIWWTIGIYIYSVIDAHIEAELSSFPDEDNLLNSSGE